MSNPETEKPNERDDDANFFRNARKHSGVRWIEPDPDELTRKVEESINGSTHRILSYLGYR